MLEHGGSQCPVVGLVDVAPSVCVGQSVLGFAVLVRVLPRGHHAEGGRAALDARSVDALVGVHERDAGSLELEPLVEGAFVREFGAELRAQCVQRQEARGTQQLVTIHATIVLRPSAGETGMPGTGYSGR
jgi:hypothetical protein